VLEEGGVELVEVCTGHGEVDEGEAVAEKVLEEEFEVIWEGEKG